MAAFLSLLVDLVLNNEAALFITVYFAQTFSSL